MILAFVVVFCLLLPWLVASAEGVFAMNAYNGAAPAGAVGVTLYFTWAELNPSQGVYTWGSIEAQLTLAASSGYPASVMIVPSLSGWYDIDGDGVTEGMYKDCSPAYAGPSRTVPLAGKIMQLPAYDSASWRSALQMFSRAFATRYDGDPRITNITVGLGLDGESHAYKSDYRVYVDRQLGTAYTAAFEKHCKELLTVYAQAFKRTPLFAACNPGGQAFRRELIDNYLILTGIGYKNAGLQIDDPTAWGPGTNTTSGGNYGLWAPMRDLQGVVPLWVESTTGLCTAESVYWALRAAMSWRPAGIDLHKEWFDANPDAIAWANSYLASPERGVWVVFRDREYGAYDPSIPGTSTMYLSGWPDDFTWGIERTSDAPRVLRASLPAECRGQIEGRQARVFDKGLALCVADPITLGTKLRVRVCYLDRQATFGLTIGGQRFELGGEGTRMFQWAELDVVAPARWDGVVSFDGGGTLHMVEILRSGAGPAEVTPTSTMTATPTPTFTATATPTVTYTPSPTETRRPCWSPLPLSWAERWGIRDTASLGLYRIEEYLDWNNDATLIWGNEEQLGTPLSAAFEFTSDAGTPLQCRAFANGIIVVDGAALPEECKNWVAIGWDGEAR